MKNFILKISLFGLAITTFALPAQAYEMYTGEGQTGNAIVQPVALNYHFYTENSPAVTVNGEQYPYSQTTASAGSYNASYSSNRNSIDNANSNIKPINTTVNKFLPSNSGEWFIVVVIVLAMLFASKYLLKAKKKEEKKSEEKKPLPKIA